MVEVAHDLLPTRRKRYASAVTNPALIRRAAVDALVKLDPRYLVRNPVIFVTAVVSALVTVLFVRDLVTGGGALFTGQLAAWLWFTVLFANFAEAIAEGRGRAQADALRRTRTETMAKRLATAADRTKYANVSALDLRPGDLVLLDAGDLVPGDGDVVEGIASVNEAAVTGESAPVIREAGGDRSAVTGGTTVISDWIVVRITSASGSSFLDRMIALVEGAERQKTPNEIALNILLAGMTIVFLAAVVTLKGLGAYSGTDVSVPVLVALLVTLIPTTIGGLLSAIGIAGMDRLLKFNVLAMSGRAVEAAGDVDTLLLDKTGTITFGNRLATEIIPVPGVSEREAAEAALLASLADETPEGRSIVALMQDKYRVATAQSPARETFIPFSAATRLSGVDIGARRLRKGAVDAIRKLTGDGPGTEPPAFRAVVDRIARSGGTPLGLADGDRLLGVIHLKVRREHHRRKKNHGYVGKRGPLGQRVTNSHGDSDRDRRPDEWREHERRPPVPVCPGNGFACALAVGEHVHRDAVGAAYELVRQGAPKKLRGEAPARAPEYDLGDILESRKAEQLPGNVAGRERGGLRAKPLGERHRLVHVAARRGRQRLARLLDGDRDPGHIHHVGEPLGRAHDHLGIGVGPDAGEDALSRRPWAFDGLRLHAVDEVGVDALSRATQRQLAQRGQVLRLEEALTRALRHVRYIDLALGEALQQLLCTMSSASSNTLSGTVSRTCTRVIFCRMSLSPSRCWMLSVVHTSMPAASSSSVSCQRLGWRLPGMLLWASSSRSSSRGLRASALSRSNSLRILLT